MSHFPRAHFSQLHYSPEHFPEGGLGLPSIEAPGAGGKGKARRPTIQDKYRQQALREDQEIIEIIAAIYQIIK